MLQFPDKGESMTLDKKLFSMYNVSIDVKTVETLVIQSSKVARKG